MILMKFCGSVRLHFGKVGASQVGHSVSFSLFLSQHKYKISLTSRELPVDKNPQKKSRPHVRKNLFIQFSCLFRPKPAPKLLLYIQEIQPTIPVAIIHHLSTFPSAPFFV